MLTIATSAAVYQSQTRTAEAESNSLEYKTTTTSANDTTPSGGKGSFVLFSSYEIDVNSVDSITLSDQAKAIVQATSDVETQGINASLTGQYTKAGLSVSESETSTDGRASDYYRSDTSEVSFENDGHSASVSVTRIFSLQTDLPLLHVTGTDAAPSQTIVASTKAASIDVVSGPSVTMGKVDKPASEAEAALSLLQKSQDSSSEGGSDLIKTAAKSVVL